MSDYDHIEKAANAVPDKAFVERVRYSQAISLRRIADALDRLVLVQTHPLLNADGTPRSIVDTMMEKPQRNHDPAPSPKRGWRDRFNDFLAEQRDPDHIPGDW